MPHPTRRKNEGNNLGRKHLDMELSERLRAFAVKKGSLALIDWPQVARTYMSSGRMVCRCRDVFLRCLTLVLFCFVFVFMLSLKPRPFVQSSFDMQPPVFSTCPLHTYSGCGEKDAHINSPW